MFSRLVVVVTIRVGRATRVLSLGAPCLRHSRLFRAGTQRCYCGQPLCAVLHRWLGVAFLGLLVCGILGLGNRAAGSCGDWLEHAEPTRVSHNSEQSTATHSRQRSVPPTGLGHRTSPPCHGPRCGQVPSHSPHPWSVKVHRISHDFTLNGVAGCDGFDNSHTAGRLELSVRALAGFPQRLERPPRV